jgi:hypothetical protein
MDSSLAPALPTESELEPLWQLGFLLGSFFHPINRDPMHHWKHSMKFRTLAALAILGTNLAAASSFAAMPVAPTTQWVIAPGQLPDLVQVASKTPEQDRKRPKRHNFGFSYRELGIIPGPRRPMATATASEAGICTPMATSIAMAS